MSEQDKRTYGGLQQLWSDMHRLADAQHLPQSSMTPKELATFRIHAIMPFLVLCLF